jgi:hypothetical protein
LSGTLVLTLQNGSTINIPLPPDGTGVKETFGLNGDANYTCKGCAVTFRFPALTIGLEVPPLASVGQGSTGVNLTGMCLMPLMRFMCSRSTGPVSSISGRIRRSSSNMQLIS